MHPSTCSCRDGGSCLPQEPLSHQHTQHFVQHQTSSARTYPESLIAWILLLTWANSKFSRTQGLFSISQSKGQSPLMETRCCPSAAVLPTLPWPQVLMVHLTCINNESSPKDGYDIRHVHSWSCDPALIFQRIFP